MKDQPPPYDEHTRAGQLQAQRLANSQKRVQHFSGEGSNPGYYPGERKVRFNQQMQQTPTTSGSPPKPGPRGVAPTGQITGSGPGYIKGKNDPTNRYRNIEKQTGGAVAYTEYDGVKHLVRLIIVALFIGAIFAVPLEYRPFWIILTTLFLLTGIGFQLYIEWDAKAYDPEVGEEEQARARGWAGSMLYFITMATSAVTVGVLMVMVWKIYCVTKANSNLLGWQKPEEQQMDVMDDQASVASGPAYEPQEYSERKHSRSRKYRF